MSDLVKILIVGVIIAGAWVAIGSPTNIQDLRTDIDNIRKQFSPQDASATTAPDSAGAGGDQGQGGQQDQGTAGAPEQQQQSAAQAPDSDSGGGGAAAAPESPSPPSKDVADSIAAKDNDIGSTNGTAAPEQANLPPVVIPKQPEIHPHIKNPQGHPLSPPLATTHAITPPHHHQFHLKEHKINGKVVSVFHNPPHTIAKVLPTHHHFVRHPTVKTEHGEHYKGTRGWYTAIGHHHCFKGQPGCICTDCSKCDCNGPGSFRGHHHHTRSHLAYAYNTNSSSGDLFSYY